MNGGQMQQISGTAGQMLTVTILALSLAACGGGGGSPGSTGAGATGATTGTTTGAGPTGASTTTATASTLTVNLVDSSAANIVSLSGGQTGVLRAVFMDATGAVIPYAVVKFTATDATLIQFTPVSASALTDAKGIATISLKPTDFSSAGALTLSADAVLGSKTASGSVNIAIGAATLALGSLTLTPAPAAGASLPAFNAITINVPVTSNGQPVNSAPGLTFNSLCKGDGTATIVPGPVSAGLATATYTNTGCTRVTDTITASIGSSTQSTPLAVSSANIGTINFVSASPSGTSLVLKGSGGLGRTETALLTYKVVDQAGTGLQGVTVTFAATTTTGGLQVLPLQATTDANGNVQTSVQSGTIPTPVRVAAQASRGGNTVTGLSDALTISTGLPIQKAMSISADKYNIEGLDYDGTIANITIRMADQYANPISDGTTINFVAEGGAVGSSLQGACQTLNGGCTVPINSQSFRPVNGRVTVLAYAQGIEDFTDTNGDGQYSCTNFTSGDGTTPATYRPLIDTCVSGGEPWKDLPDAYLDTGSHAVLRQAQSSPPASPSMNQLFPTAATAVLKKLDLGVDGVAGLVNGLALDGSYDAAQGDLPVPYGHMTYSATGDGHWGVNYIRRSTEIIFSGSIATLYRVDPSTMDDFSDRTDMTISGVAGLNCSDKILAFRLTDANNNPLPAGTTVAQGDANKISAGTFSPAVVLSTAEIGGTYHRVTIKADSACAPGTVDIVATTPKGIKSTFTFKSN